MSGADTSKLSMEELERIRTIKDAFIAQPLYPGRKKYIKVSV
jgi:hypothetical protein